MSQWTPVWRLAIDGGEYQQVALADLTITSGRTDIFLQPVAGYCTFRLLNFDNQTYPFDVNTQVAIEVKNSSGTFVPIFGGFISDFSIQVQSAGSVGVVTSAVVTAVGALSKLTKIITEGVLSSEKDGDQIYDSLSGYLLNSWNEVSPAQTWAAYDPTTTWAGAENIGLGEIDRPGTYTMISRSSSNINLYTLVTEIAKSGFGYLYEDANGNIGYADTTHRQNYLAANGYTVLDANNALANGISTQTRSGDIRNKFTLNYGNNGNSHYTSENAQSQTSYGIKALEDTYLVKDTIDATALADRYIALRAFPYPKFQSITFSLGNPEINNSQRNALLNIFMGQPVQINNLPLNIADGQFQGYIEGWTFRASYNNLSVTFNATPVSMSQVAVKWGQVSAAESWSTISPTLTWNNAIGAVA